MACPLVTDSIAPIFTLMQHKSMSLWIRLCNHTYKEVRIALVADHCVFQLACTSTVCWTFSTKRPDPYKYTSLHNVAS